MPEARGIGFEIVEVQSCDVVPEAVAPASDGCFVLYFPQEGFKYLDAEENKFNGGISFAGSISPEFGLFPCQHDDSKWISFVESPPKSFVTLTSAGQVAGRTSCNQGRIVAVCNSGHALATTLASTGHVRFIDLTTGKAAGKNTKLPDMPQGNTPSAFTVCKLKSREIICMRQERPGANPHFWILRLDELDNVSTGGRRTLNLKTGNVAQSLGQFNQLESISGTESSNDKLLLCWKTPPLPNGYINGIVRGSYPPKKKFCSASLQKGEVRRLDAFADVPLQTWHTMESYFVEFWSTGPEETSEAAGTLRFRLRDSRFGLFVAAGEATLENPPSTKLLMASTSSFSLAATNGSLVGIRWTAPKYALARAIGAGASVSSHQKAEDATRKRKREDTEKTEEHPEVCNITPARLSKIIRRLRGPHTRCVAFLKRQLSIKDLPFVLSTVVMWLSHLRDLGTTAVISNAPRIPTRHQLSRFLTVLADGFLQSLVQLPSDQVQKVIERLVTSQNEIVCIEKLLSKATAVVCEKPIQLQKPKKLKVEISSLDI